MHPDSLNKIYEASLYFKNENGEEIEIESLESISVDIDKDIIEDQYLNVFNNEVSFRCLGEFDMRSFYKNFTPKNKRRSWYLLKHGTKRIKKKHFKKYYDYKHLKGD